MLHRHDGAIAGTTYTDDEIAEERRERALDRALRLHIADVTFKSVNRGDVIVTAKAFEAFLLGTTASADRDAE